jgi:hypothetical protein
MMQIYLFFPGRLPWKMNWKIYSKPGWKRILKKDVIQDELKK